MQLQFNTSYGLCECGCGQATKIPTRTYNRENQIKGQPRRFLKGHWGRLHTKPTTPFAIRFWAKVNKDGPVPQHCPELGNCWLWIAGTTRGYGRIQQSTSLMAHRVSYVMHYGVIPDGMYVCHKCDNPSCVRPDHLFLGTQIDNMADMVAKNRSGKHT